MTNTTEVTVEEAWERYARNKRSNPEYSDGTVDTYRNGVDKFMAWLEEKDLQLGDLDAWTVGDFTPWMEENYDLQANTVASYTKGVQQLLNYCAEKGLIAETVADGHETRTASKEEKQWDKEIDVQRAEDIASYLQQHYPGHRDTVIFTVLLRTGMRMSGLRAIDLGDIYERDGSGWVIDLRDREDTSLKDSDEHERVINIRQDTWELINEYANNHRKDVTDNGRKPLITTRHGRASDSTVRTAVYKATCPNRTGIGECDCEPPVSKAKARECDERHSPHALRAAHVTHARDRDVSWGDVSGRVGCQTDTLKLHYDRAGKEQQAERRRSILADL